ncbi:hypothetical protein EW146_g4039 [Bondarzewia mesenterica]|uniref:Uncharacterized protein n=1 Tax=Bondarzewia mesenterica TaxID=1095465 RepID=A0A4S4LVR5_9AGAM|nr:hypothetical protein EW146_g4039 [Bondarzewia mesenterica]
MGTWDLRQRVKREGDVAAASGTAKQDADDEAGGGCFRVDGMDENKPRPVTEKCKHAGCDRIVLGQARPIFNDETASKSSRKESTLEGEPFVTFSFSYWPTAHLQAKGVIPTLQSNATATTSKTKQNANKRSRSESTHGGETGGRSKQPCISSEHPNTCPEGPTRTPEPLPLNSVDAVEPVTTIKGENGEAVMINANSDIAARFKALQEKRLALQAEEDAIMLDARQDPGASVVKRDASPIRLQGSSSGTLIDLTLDADDS